MAPRTDTSRAVPTAEHRLAFNVDALAITLALSLAVLIRLNLLPHIGW